MKAFVAGLSKSGKSARCQFAASLRTDLEYVGVSERLRATGGILPVRTFTDALFNQRKVVDILLKSSLGWKHQIIDGHAIIETQEGPMIVPDELFEKVRPDLLIYIQDEPNELYRRRSAVGMLQTPTELAALTTLERAVCERIAVRHGITLTVMHSATFEAFSATLDQRLGPPQ